MGKRITSCPCCGAPGLTCGDYCTLPSEYYLDLISDGSGNEVTESAHFECNGVEHCSNLIGSYVLTRVSQLYSGSFQFDPEIDLSTSPYSYFIPLRGLSRTTVEGILYMSDEFNLCDGDLGTLDSYGCPNPGDLETTDCVDGYRLILFLPTQAAWLDRYATEPAVVNSEPCGGYFGLWSTAFLESSLSHGLLSIGVFGASCEPVLENVTGLDFVLAIQAHTLLRNIGIAGTNRMQIVTSERVCSAAYTQSLFTIFSGRYELSRSCIFNFYASAQPLNENAPICAVDVFCWRGDGIYCNEFGGIVLPSFCGLMSPPSDVLQDVYLLAGRP